MSADLRSMTVEALETERLEAWARLEGAGGRGVEEAERVDAIDAELDRRRLGGERLAAILESAERYATHDPGVDWPSERHANAVDAICVALDEQRETKVVSSAGASGPRTEQAILVSLIVKGDDRHEAEQEIVGRLNEWFSEPPRVPPFPAGALLSWCFYEPKVVNGR